MIDLLAIALGEGAVLVGAFLYAVWRRHQHSALTTAFPAGVVGLLVFVGVMTVTGPNAAPLRTVFASVSAGASALYAVAALIHFRSAGWEQRTKEYLALATMAGLFFLLSAFVG